MFCAFVGAVFSLEKENKTLKPKKETLMAVVGK